MNGQERSGGVQGQETLVFQPVGQCIYCGVKRYSSTREKLGREHIVPEALGGKAILPEASCHDCEVRIGRRIEMPLLKGYFDTVRYSYGIRSKRNHKKRQPTRHVDFLKGDDRVPIELQHSEAPALLTMQEYRVPGCLERDLSPDRHWKKPEFRKFLICRPDLIDQQINDFDVDGIADTCTREHFELMPYFLAKIAHSYAATDGTRFLNFGPVLGAHIRGEKTQLPISFFVGNLPEAFSGVADAPTDFENDGGHVLRMFEGIAPPLEFLAVYIQLFAHLDTPKYMVVVALREMGTNKPF